MGVTNLTVSQRYATNGSTDTFAIPFQFIEGDVGVIKVYEVNMDTGAKTLLTKGPSDDYELDDPSDPSNVVFNTAPDDVWISVERLMPLKQLTDYINTGRFIAESHEVQMDKMVMMIQQLDEMYQRTIKGSLLDLDEDFDFDLPLLSDYPGYIIVINDSGTGFELIDPEDIEIGATRGSDNISEGQAATNVNGMTATRGTHTSKKFEVEIVRGTTVMSKKELNLLDFNGTWALVEGAEMKPATAVLSGITWTVAEAGGVANIKAAIGADGLGNGTLKWIEVGIDA